MAEQQKASGNACFTAGKYAEAAKSYEKAAALAPKDPVYLSNLSAAQFELGQYDTCVATILKTSPLLSGASDALKRKLSHRLARALCHIRLSATPTTVTNPAAIQRFEDFVRSGSLEDAPSDEVVAAWSFWHRIQGGDIGKLRRESQTALTKQLLFKNMQASFGLEYYTVGQDDAETLLATAPLMPDIDITRFKNPQLSELSFLFGGCGDSRHAFSTLIDVHQESLGLKAAQRTALRVHMTLVDIHPTTVARVLLNLTLLGELADALGTPDEEEAAATFLYLFIAPVVPSYVHNRALKAMEKIVQQLETSTLPAWIVCSLNPAPVIAALRYWIQLKVDTRDYMDKVSVHISKSMDDMLAMMTGQGMQISPEYMAMMKSSKTRAEANVRQTHASIPDARLRELVPGGAGMSRTQLRAHVDKALTKNMPFFTDRIAKAGMKEEDMVYRHLKSFLPCASLLQKYHKPMVPLATEIVAMTINPYDLRDPPAGLPTKAALDGAVGHMHKEWRANPLTFDRHMPRETFSGYKECTWDLFGLLAGFDTHIGPRIRDGTKPNLRMVAGIAFERGSYFFRQTARAMKALRGKLTFEVVAGDVYSWLERCHLGLARPEGSPWPTKYTRMWFSNVPDYGGGPLDLAVYVVPCLQPLTTACAVFNILLNTGTWKSMEHYNFHYSLMNINDMPRLLGCELHSRSPNDNLAVAPALNKRLDGVSRSDLTQWLVRVLVHLVYHGKSGMHQTGARVDTPNTLAFFVRLLIYLHSAGVPAHVLADILQNVLSDRISSDVRPYVGLLPITPHSLHSGKPRKLVLAPWLAELEAIVAQTRYALPFALQLPASFPDSRELVTCEANARIFDDYMLGNTLRQPALALLLYSPNFEVRRLGELYPRLLEGDNARDALVFTGFGIERVLHKISWTMSRARAGALQAAQWRLCVFRLETCKLATDTVPAKQWIVPSAALDVEPLD